MPCNRVLHFERSSIALEYRRIQAFTGVHGRHACFQASLLACHESGSPAVMVICGLTRLQELMRVVGRHRWRPGNVFHASALCASVIDTATLPYRLTRIPRPGPLGVPVGGCHLRSLTELLVRSLQPTTLPCWLHFGHFWQKAMQQIVRPLAGAHCRETLRTPADVSPARSLTGPAFWTWCIEPCWHTLKGYTTSM